MRMVKRNKGFSFVEILVAITLLAIIIGPIMNSLISTARINKESRRLMCASDVAQNIMEGFSDKEYYELLLSTYWNLGSPLSGKAALSNINGNVYNGDTAGYKYTAFSNVNACTNQSITFVDNDGNPITLNTVKLLDEQNPEMIGSYRASDYMLRKWATMASGVQAGTFTTNPKLIMYSNVTAPAGPDDPIETKNTCIFFAYTNVDWKTYKFDVYGYVIPTAQNSTDIYYPYTIKVLVYERPKNDGGLTVYGMDEQAIVTMTGGIRSK